MSITEAGTAKSMKKYIRFSGLVGFFAVMSLVVVLLYLFAETLVKATIEEVGGTMLGAEVNVASVELQYSPLILTINNLEATDAEQPSHNLFSVKQSKAGIDIWQYLLGKTIIEQLTVEKLQLMTKRDHIGEIYSLDKRGEKIESLIEELPLPAMDLKLPDTKSILDDSNLLTIKAAEQLQTGYEEEKLKLAALKEKLPNKAKLAAYNVRIKNIGKMKVKNLDDFNRVKLAFDTIKKEFNADQAIVKAAQKQFLESKERLTKQVTTLKSAPNQDWQIIEEKYQLGSVNTEDFAHILFGEQARGYYQKLEKVYQHLAPFINSDSEVNQEKTTKLEANGRFVHFDENSPLPDFLVKRAKLSVVLEQGDFEITAKEVTHQHWYRNKPSKVSINSTHLTNGGDIRVDSQFELTKTGSSTGQGQWLIKEIILKDMPLTEVSSLALTLTEGKLSGKGEFNINQDRNIESKSDFAITAATYQGEADTKFAEILLDTFKSLDKLTLGINVTGNIQQPKWGISSSLDEAVQGAFKKQIANKLAKFKTQINSGLNEKLAQSLQLNEQKNTEIVNFEALLGNTDNALEQLKNSDVVKQQKKKLQNKATDKLKSKLSDLFG